MSLLVAQRRSCSCLTFLCFAYSLIRRLRDIKYTPRTTSIMFQLWLALFLSYSIFPSLSLSLSTCSYNNSYPASYNRKMAQPQLLQIKLSRFDAQPWGFRLQGGVDFAQPLLVQKVSETRPHPEDYSVLRLNCDWSAQTVGKSNLYEKKTKNLFLNS